MQRLQSLDPDIYRLFVFDTQAGHFEDKFLSNINLVTTPADGASLDEIFAETVLQLPASIPNLTVVESNIFDEDDDRYGIIVSVWNSELLSGEVVEVYQYQVIYLLDDTALTITFSSTTDFKDSILTDFEAMLEGFARLR